MRDILDAVFDRGSRFEMGARCGRSLITCLARLDGRPVGVLASDPVHYGGGMTADAADKLVRFVDMCDQFHLPVVNLVDQPGFVIGTESERQNTMRRGARALAAVYQAEVPWVSILVRKVFGVAGAGHGDGSRLNLRYAWPSGDWGSLPIEGGLEAAYRRELEAAADRVAAARRDRGAAECRAVAVSHRRALQRGGDHRPARHASAAVRLGGPRARADRPRAARRAPARGVCALSRDCALVARSPGSPFALATLRLVSASPTPISMSSPSGWRTGWPSNPTSS